VAASQVTVFANYSVTPLSKSSRMVSTHALAARQYHRAYILVSFHTPVAYYDLDTDILYATLDPDVLTPTTRCHIRDFGRTIRPGHEALCIQEVFNQLLCDVTSERELA